MDERSYMARPATPLSQAIEIDPGYVNARVNLATLSLLSRRSATTARKEYLKCMELEPKACDCRQGLGRHCCRQPRLR